MLFNSYGFILVYLPVVIAGFFWLSTHSHRLAALWLAAVSVFFYGWWNPAFVGLLLASISFNYGAGYLIGHVKDKNKSSRWLVSAVFINLALLAFFKYTNFFIATLNSAGAQWGGLDIVLPLGISFFTFTQIAFLVDVHRGIAREYNFIHYLLFVTWFPHLIAGPVLHHKQMMPQFARLETYCPNAESIAVGLTLFALGLFKKVVLADQYALYANPVFDAAATGSQPMLFEAWVGALAYTLQLYFDFSGYSDMAVGLSRIFNIKLPLNFHSPYKAANIIECWRRWHMTLSAFLRDYLYYPLGGNQKGPVRRHLNLMVTMLLGGLWHGAGWNYVLWGGLHGVYLMINHAWRALTGGASASASGRMAGVGITFAAVVVAWVPFRASHFEATQAMLGGMAGFNGVSLPIPLEAIFGKWLGEWAVFTGFLPIVGIPTREWILWLLSGVCVIWFLPNSQQWLARFSPAWDSVASSSRLAWKPTRGYAILVGCILGVGFLSMNRVSDFLYFQF